MKKRLTIFLIVAALACSFCFASEAAEDAIPAETAAENESTLITLPLPEVQLETDTIQEELPAETAENTI